MACQQQTRLLFKLFREHHIPGIPNPHRQFILDIQSWITHLTNLGHEIILALDANETYNPDIPGSLSPLQYTPGVPTYSKTHDGKLSTLVASCNLQDPLAYQHSDCPFPPSHIRGANRIDYIFVTPGLRSAVLSSGSLPFYSIFQGDHRPYYIDISSIQMVSDHTHEIHKPAGRSLRLMDPRAITKYCEFLHKELQYQKKN
jgi:hypothetical protein